MTAWCRLFHDVYGLLLVQHFPLLCLWLHRQCMAGTCGAAPTTSCCRSCAGAAAAPDAVAAGMAPLLHLGAPRCHLMISLPCACAVCSRIIDLAARKSFGPKDGERVFGCVCWPRTPRQPLPAASAQNALLPARLLPARLLPACMVAAYKPRQSVHAPPAGLPPASSSSVSA